MLRDTVRYIARLPCGGAMKKVLEQAVEWEVAERYADAGVFCAALREAGEADAGEAALPPVAARPERTTSELVNPGLTPGLVMGLPSGFRMARQGRSPTKRVRW